MQLMVTQYHRGLLNLSKVSEANWINFPSQSTYFSPSLARITILVKYSHILHIHLSYAWSRHLLHWKWYPLQQRRYNITGASLSEPHINESSVSQYMYIYMVRLSCVCRTIGISVKYSIAHTLLSRQLKLTWCESWLFNDTKVTPQWTTNFPLYTDSLDLLV